MREDFEMIAAWFAIVLGFVLLMLLLAWGLNHISIADDADCKAAFDLSEQRHALAESTVGLTYDAWRADSLGDDLALDYATTGIEQNNHEITTIETEYEEAKDACE